MRTCSVFEITVINSPLALLYLFVIFHLVPPSEVVLVPYGNGAVVEVAEDAEFVISCEARNAKPAAVLNWFTDGNLIKENVRKKNVPNRNFTINSQAKLHWTPKLVLL